MKVWKREDLQVGMFFISRYDNKYTYKITTLEGDRIKITSSEDTTVCRHYEMILRDINNGTDICLPYYNTKLGKYLYELDTKQ